MCVDLILLAISVSYTIDFITKRSTVQLMGQGKKEKLI